MLDDFARAEVAAEKADELYYERGTRPFSAGGTGVLRDYADQRIDISAEWAFSEAPQAIEAILDYHFGDGRHRDDYGVARWRLQLLAELGVGWQVRQSGAEEAAKVQRLASTMMGERNGPR